MKDYGTQVRNIVNFVDKHPYMEAPMTGVLFACYCSAHTKKQLIKLQGFMPNGDTLLKRTAVSTLAVALVMSQSNLIVLAEDTVMIDTIMNDQSDGQTPYQKITVESGTKVEDIKLPESLQITDKDGQVLEVEVTWNADDYQDSPSQETVYRFQAEFPSNYALEYGKSNPWIEVTVKQPTINNYNIAPRSAQTTVSTFQELQVALADSTVQTIIVTQSFSLTDTLMINHDVSISGVNEDITLTRGTDKLLFKVTVGNVQLEKLCIDGKSEVYADAFPILVNQDGQVTLNEGLILQNNKGLGYDINQSASGDRSHGVAIINRSDGKMTLNGAIIRNNTTLDPKVQNVNSGSAGIGNEGTLIMNSGEISGNISDTYGGGVTNFGTMEVNGGSILNNKTTSLSANNNGAGIMNGAYRINDSDEIKAGTLTINDGLFSGNTAANKTDGRGGAIYNVSYCTLNMYGGVIDSTNQAVNGAGIFHSGQSGSGAILKIKNNPLINAPIYLYNGLSLSLEASLVNNLTIQPQTLTDQSKLAEGSSGYQITQNDAEKIKIYHADTKSWYAEKKDNQIVLTSQKPSYKQQEVYVDGKNGSDSNSGTIDNPVKSIDKAVDLIDVNGTIYIENPIGITTETWIDLPKEVYGDDPIITNKPGYDGPIIIVYPGGNLHIEDATITGDIENQGGTITTGSNTELPAITGPLTITKQPISQSISTNETFRLLSVESSGKGIVSYQWYKSVDGQTEGEKIAGATTATYQPDQNPKCYYYCVVTVTNGKQTLTATSDKANLEINSLDVEDVTIPSFTYGDSSTTANLTLTNHSGTNIVVSSITTASGNFIFDYQNATVTANGVNTACTVKAKDHLKAGNYDEKMIIELNSGQTIVAEVKLAIGKRDLIVQANTPITKVYDGTKNVDVKTNHYILNGKVSGDTLDISYNASFDSKNAVDANHVLLTNIVLNGDDKNNYTLKTTELSIDGTITPKSLGLQAGKAITKIYDGTRDAVVLAENYVYDGKIGGDTIDISYDATFNSENIEDASQVILTNILLNGPDAKNYALNTVSLSISGSITNKSIQISLKPDVSIRKEYSDQTTISLNNDYFDIAGLIGNDTVTVSGIGHFNDKTVGNNKVIIIDTLIISGSDSKKYALETTSIQGVGTITPKPLSLQKGTAITKIYDGTRDAVIIAENYRFSGKIAGDTLGISYDAAFNSANVADANSIVMENIVLEGQDKDNYTLNTDTLQIDGTIKAKEVSADWEINDHYVYNRHDQSNAIHVRFKDVNQQTQALSFTFGEGITFCNADTYQATLSNDNPNYSFTNDTKTYMIEPKSLSNSMLSGIDPSYQFTSQEITPEPILYDGTQLVRDHDYSVLYQNNKDKGTATITIQGVGNYKDKLTKTFEIGYALYSGKLLPEMGRNTAGYYREDILVKAPQGYQISTDDNQYQEELRLSNETDAGTFQYYIKNMENNLIYVGSEDYALDKTAPTLQGVVDNETYYVDQMITIHENNIKSITFNNISQDVKDTVRLPGNQNQKYILKVTDIADNEVTIQITMKTLTSYLPDISIDYVKDGDQTVIQDAMTNLQKLPCDFASDSQKQEIIEHIDRLQSMLDKITEVNNTIQDIQNQYQDIQKLTREDQVPLNDMKQEVEKLLNSHNLSEAQTTDLVELKEQVDTDIQEVVTIIQKYDDAKNIVNSNDIKNVKTESEQEITKAKEDLESLKKENHLTDDELLSYDSLQNKAEELLNRIEAVQQKLDKLDEVDNIQINTVEKTDKADILNVKGVIDEIKQNYPTNLNPEQNQTVQSKENHANNLKQVLDKVDEVENMIGEIKDSGHFSDQEIIAAEALLKLYDSLSEHQKQLVDVDKKAKLDNVMRVIGIQKLKDKQSGITVEGLDALFLPSTKLEVTIVTQSMEQSRHEKMLVQLKPKEIVLEIFDLKLMLENEQIEPNGKVKVTIPLTDKQATYQNLRLVYVDEAGVITEIPFAKEGNQITFVAEHFSNYAILGENQGDTHVINTGDSTALNGYKMLLLTSMGILIVTYWKSKEQELADIPDCFKGINNRMRFAKFISRQALEELKSHFKKR